MRLVRFPSSDEDTAVQQLPEPDMVVDPRPLWWLAYVWTTVKFKVTVKGTALTITRIDPPKNRDHRDRPTGWCEEGAFRVYNINEHRYSFESMKYLYHGLDGEDAPRDATEIIVKDGIETIEECAFSDCNSLVKVTIPDSVKRIEAGAFAGCESLRFIQFPPKLQYIGRDAFCGCFSLEAVYLPPTVKEIGDQAFEECTSLRILNIPDNVQYIGRDIINEDCHSLMTDEMAEATSEEQIEWLRNRYNPLHKLCCHPSVTPQAITQYIQYKNNKARTNDKPKFTALHLLAANPSVTGDMITAYLQLAPDVAVMQDNIGQTPLHMLCSLPHFSDGAGSAIRSYFAFKEGREAAFMTDSQGKTPFQYLCEKSFDEMPFLKEDNKSFGGLFFWWFDCLEINMLVEVADMKEINR